MKKLMCLLLASLLLAACAVAETTPPTFTLRFDEGFSLDLPEGWVSYPAGEGTIRYTLGDGSGHYLYILAEPSDFADFEAMRAALDAWTGSTPTSSLDLNGQPFAAFIAPQMNAGGCSTLLNGEMLTILFTPQNDAGFTATMAGVMASFQLIEEGE